MKIEVNIPPELAAKVTAYRAAARKVIQAADALDGQDRDRAGQLRATALSLTADAKQMLRGFLADTADFPDEV